MRVREAMPRSGRLRVRPLWEQQAARVLRKRKLLKKEVNRKNRPEREKWNVEENGRTPNAANDTGCKRTVFVKTGSVLKTTGEPLQRGAASRGRTSHPAGAELNAGGGAQVQECSGAAARHGRRQPQRACHQQRARRSNARHGSQLPCPCDEPATAIKDHWVAYARGGGW